MVDGLLYCTAGAIGPTIGHVIASRRVVTVPPTLLKQYTQNFIAAFLEPHLLNSWIKLTFEICKSGFDHEKTKQKKHVSGY